MTFQAEQVIPDDQDFIAALETEQLPIDDLGENGRQVLEALDYPTHGFRSKAWDEFAVDGVPKMDFVFTVCDDAAGEACPVWPGQPMTAHWGIEDPSNVKGTDIEKERSFSTAARFMKNRIMAFLSLPHDSIDRMALDHHLKAIGKLEGTTSKVRTLPDHVDI